MLKRGAMAAFSNFPRPLFLSAATRSPIGKFGGSLKRFTAPQLAALTLKEAQRRSQIDGLPDFVILGQARQAGAGPNTARQATIFSGFPNTVPALTVNQACASGMTAIFAACEKIASGRAHNIWAGGVESMSNTPYLLTEARWGKKLGHSELVDAMYKDGLFCPMAQMIMGETVQNFIADEQNISRADQDAFALSSQQKAAIAWKAGDFKDETFAIAAEGKAPGLARDEHMREDSSLESLAKLPGVFAKDGQGSITAGNSSGIVDGAAFVHVSDQRHPTALVEILDFETVALDPEHMGLGPIPATQALLKRQGLTVSDIEAFEFNEAFAAQVLASARTLQVPMEKINMRGGAIAIGHPIGASGARITVTLAHILKSKPGALGLATLCVSGGLGAAILIRSL